MAANQPPALVHDALFYRDETSYLEGTVPFILDAVAAGVPTLVSVPRRNGEVIRRELGRDAERVRVLDMTIDGRNPGRIIPAIIFAFVDEHSGRPVAFIGEPIWAGRSAVEYPACVQHEALINTVFAAADAKVLCPYDTQALEPEVLADAARTHPDLVLCGERRRSHRYTDPTRVVATFNRPLPEPEHEVAAMRFQPVDDLLDVRRFVGGHAASAGLPEDRVFDLQAAAHELLTNTVRHSGGGGVVRVWRDEQHVVCDVTDGGHIRDPLAGSIPQPATSGRGRGLLRVNHICDLVRIYTVPGVTTVRLYIRLS
jgi:anti-sigma regulatory factor (Ser/Thr protein kinase)